VILKKGGMKDMISAFIFDFDGVIADTESAWVETLWEFAERYGLDIPFETLERYVGDGDSGMMDMLANRLGSRQKLDSLYSELTEDFARRTENLGVRDGVLSYMDFAARNGIKLACASNSGRPYIDLWLSKLGLAEKFAVTVTRSDVGTEGMKPRPDIYIMALRMLSLHPEDVLAFEDSYTGIKAAEAAGIRCILVPNRVTENKTSSLPNYRLSMARITPEQLFSDLRLSFNDEDLENE
jgi:putative hydrolase of the HAD superfamily